MAEDSIKRLKTLIAILFIISGATGLIYQVVWFKYLGLFLGNTTYAQMVVLSAFLGGLALGNSAAGKRADKLKNPLLVYSTLEFFVGLYCLAYPHLSEAAGNFFIAVGQAGNLSDTGGVLLTTFRFALSVSLLLLPTIAMGATLPVLSKAFITDLRASQRDMAILYGLNSLGAVLGVFYSGFLLIQYFGLDITLYLSALVNLALGVTGAVFSQVFKTSAAHPEIGEAEKDGAPAEKKLLSPKALFIIIAAAGSSGFAALLYEMVWVRLLIQVFGSSTYAFSLMLMAFISGITIGSLIASSAVFRKFNKVKVIAFSQAAIALSTLPVLLVYDRLIYYTWVIAANLQKNDTTFSIFLAAQFLLCFLTIIVPTIFMGITLPVIVSVVADQRKAIGASVGRVFTVNTAGCVLGAVSTGIVLIPQLGMRGAFETGMFINLAGAVLLYIVSPGLTKRRKFGYAGSLAVLFIAIHFFAPEWNVKLTLASVFRQLNNPAPETFAKFCETYESRKLLYYKEGLNANVAVVEYADSARTKALVINSKADASDGSDMTTQVLLGQIPMLLHRDAKDVFIVGLGSGATAASVLTHPVKEVHCAEIAKEVVETAGFFKRVNDDCINDSRFRVHVEDALTYLKLSPKQFDVIISEPSNPWIAGIGNLFSKEYFDLCKSKLRADGIMTQWFHLYEMDDDIIRLVMNTFAQVFPHKQLWNSADGDIIMVGSKSEIRPDAERLIGKFGGKKVFANLKRIDIDNPFTFLSMQMFDTGGFYAISAFDEVNSERHPLLEFRAPRSLFKGVSALRVFEEDDRYRPRYSDLLIMDYLKKHQPDAAQLNNAIRFHYIASRLYRLSYSLSTYALSVYPTDSIAQRYRLYAAELLPAFKIRGGMIGGFDKATAALPDWQKIQFGDKLEVELLRGCFLAKADIDTYAEELLKLVPAGDSVAMVRQLAELAECYARNDEPEKVVRYAKQAQAMLSRNRKLNTHINIPRFIYNTALSNAQVNNFKTSLEYLMAMQSYYPRYERKQLLNRKVELLMKKKYY